MANNDTSPFDLSALEGDVELALRGAHIYDIDSYGWLNENDPDPDLIGHAMWQTDQPQIDYNALFGESPVRRRPAETEKQILTLGEDLCGLMQASRLSLGLALVWAPKARLNALNETPHFWLHHMNAFLSLAIASDRLRDLLIVACTGEAPKVFEGRGDKREQKRNRRYVTPFEVAGQLLLGRSLKDQRLNQALSDLPRDAESIFKNIDRRNAIVHEIATRMAKQVRESIADLQRKYDEEQKTGFQPRSANPDDWFPDSDMLMNERRAEIDSAVTALCDWYLLLIKASNNVFQVEYWSRILG